MSSFEARGACAGLRWPLVRRIKLGIVLWGQATDWPGLLEAARRVDRLGYDHLWAWDHLYAVFGDPHQPNFEAYTSLAAWAMATERVGLGLLVGANTLRNPGLVAKSIATVDHISNGRAIMGLGAAWFGAEHKAFGLDFGTGFGERLDWLDESVGAIRRLLRGESVTSVPGGRYAFNDLVLQPRPVHNVPILIGGIGERKTLRTVARHADMWNAGAPLDVLTRKVAVLREHCVAVGRDISEIEFTLMIQLTLRDTRAEAERVWKAAIAHCGARPSEVSDGFAVWAGTPQAIAERLRPFVELGFETIISEQPAPYDDETLERFVGEVLPLLADD